MIANEIILVGLFKLITPAGLFWLLILCEVALFIPIRRSDTSGQGGIHAKDKPKCLKLKIL